jgi:hypothetical protein
MAKQDFARKRRSGSSASRKPARQPARQTAPRRAAPPPRRTPWGLLLVTLVVLGGLGALVYTLLQTPPETTATTTAAEAPKPTVKPKPAPKPAPTPAPEPEPEKSRFEFYEMLPKAEVVAPKVDGASLPAAGRLLP